MRTAHRIVLSLAHLSFLAAGGCALGGEGEGEGEGACATAVDSADVDAFFASLSCDYELIAADRQDGGTADTAFVHGTAYTATIGANKLITIDGEADPLVFDFDADAGTFDDQDNETNVFITSDGRQLVLQWDKEDESLELVVSDAQSNWSFTAEGPPSPLLESGTHGDVSFAVGSYSGPITSSGSFTDGPAFAAALCDPISAVIDAQARLTLTLAGEETSLSGGPAVFRVLQFNSGDIEISQLLWQPEGGPQVTIEFQKPGDGEPALDRIAVTRTEAGREVGYNHDPNNTTACP